MSYLDRAREVLDIEMAGLQRVRDSIGPEFDRAVERLLRCINSGHKIVVTGVGKNLPIGQKMAATLTSTGSPTVFLHPIEAMHGELGILSDGDVVLALSYSGESEELTNLLPAIKRRDVEVIAITGSRDNALAKESHEVICVAVDREACPFNMAPTTTTTVTLAIGDALAMVLIEARGFQKEDYAKLHPGGAIGRTLLLKVEDVMRSGERVASLPKTAKVKDALMAMTTARTGAVVVVDEKGMVVGVFTDGDLRRHLNRNACLPDVALEDVMSRNPLMMNKNLLAVDLLAVFEKHTVDDLVIVDDEGRLAGMVDIQDLPKFKIL